MKKLIMLIAVMSIMIIQGCSRAKVDAGEEGVFIYQPMFFGSEGVDSRPVLAGATWKVITTNFYVFNMKPIKYSERFEDLTASDNVAIDFDMYLTLQKNSGSAPEIYERWGDEFYENNIKDVFRKVTRNAARNYSSIQLRTDENIINQMQEIISEKMTSYLEKEGIPIKVKKAITGKVVPPAEVLAEAAKTAAQKQKQKTEVQKVKTEQSRKQAEGARALADKEYMKKLGMSTDQFIRLKELDIIEGKENVTVYMGVSPIPIKSM